MAGKTRGAPGQVQTEVMVEQFRKNRHVKRVHSTCSDFDRERNDDGILILDPSTGLVKSGGKN